MIVHIGLDGKIKKLILKGGQVSFDSSGGIPDTATITINGDTQDLVDNPNYTISASAVWGSITGTLSDQTDLNTALAAKAPLASPTFTGTVTSPAIIVSSETASRIAILDASKNIKSADTTTYPSLTELSYVKGLTSSAQTQIDGKQATFGSQTQNYIYAAPNGSAGTPSFRAMVAADVPTLNQNTTGSAATLTTSRGVDGIDFNGSANIRVNNLINIFEGLGGVSKSQSWFGGSEIVAANGTLANQRLYIVATWIPKSENITGIAWQQVINGNYTANNNNRIGLCTYSGGNLTLVASCANDGNLWQPGSAGFKKKAFSSVYPATAGLHFIVALYCRSAETTAPQIQHGPTGVASLLEMDFTDSAKLQGNVNFQTDLMGSPLAMSGVTTLAQAPKFWTY